MARVGRCVGVVRGYGERLDTVSEAGATVELSNRCSNNAGSRSGAGQQVGRGSQSSVGVRAARVGREWFWVVMSGLDVSEGDVSWCVGSMIPSRCGFVVRAAEGFAAAVTPHPRPLRHLRREGSPQVTVSPRVPRRRTSSRLTFWRSVPVPVTRRSRKRSSGVDGSTSCVRCSRPGGNGGPGGVRRSTPTMPTCGRARRSLRLRGSARSGESRPVPVGRSPRGSTT